MHAFYTLRWGKIAQESKLSRSLPVKNAKVCCFWVSDLPINTNKRFMLAKVRVIHKYYKVVLTVNV